MEGIKRRRLSSQAWQELFQRHAVSGEPIGAFCRREGVSAHSFRRWKLRLGAQPSTAASKSGATARPAQVRPVAAAPFVELGALGPAPSAAPRLELRLDLGGGVTLHVVRG